MLEEESDVAPQIRRATPPDLRAIVALLSAYYEAFAIQQRDDEAQTLIQIDDPRLGYFVAEFGGRLVGCVLLKPLPDLPRSAECKRLFVLPQARGFRLGERLMHTAESFAAAAGYEWIYLDSNPSFAKAIVLYERRGYTACPRYNDNPQATIFLRKRLREMA